MLREFIYIISLANKLMNRTKTYVFIVLITLACSPQRMIDSSHRNRPDWVFGVQRSYLIGHGTGRDVAEARGSALNNIKAQIAQAVFSEIQSSKHYNIREVQSGKTFELIISFVSETVSKTNGGFITRGVSLSDASDYYYEIVRDRNTRRETVRYSVKYPFSRMELDSYLREWERRQLMLIEQRDEIAARIGRHESIEEIIADIYKLVQIREMLEGENAVEAAFIVSDMYSYINSVRLEVFEEGYGFLRFGLIYGDNELKAGVRPRVSAEGVVIESLFQRDGHWIATYRENQDLNSEGRRPSLNFVFAYRTWKLKHTYQLTPNVDINILSPMLFNAKRVSFFGARVRSFDYMIKTEVLGLGGVVLERIMMHPVKISGANRESLATITLDFANGINMRSGSRYHTLRFETDLVRKDFSIKDNSRIIVSGSLFYREVITGEHRTLNFRGIELRTDW